MSGVASTLNRENFLTGCPERSQTTSTLYLERSLRNIPSQYQARLCRYAKIAHGTALINQHLSLSRNHRKFYGNELLI